MSLYSTLSWLLPLIWFGLSTGIAWAQTGDTQVRNLDSTSSDTIQILYPADRSSIASEKVQLIALAKAGEIPISANCDGKSISVQSMQFAESWIGKGAKVSFVSTNGFGGNPSTWLKDKAGKVLVLTTLNLKPGEHSIELGDAKLRLMRSVTVDIQTPPADWVLFRPHPSVVDTNQPIACSSCHEVKVNGDPGRLGRAKLPDACQTCHDAVDLRLAHSHVMEPLSNCVMCHDPHGSRQPSLLLAAKEKLCTQCHEGGHTR